MFWLHFGILLLAIYIGIRVGGVGLGLIGGAGVTIFTFAFGMKPGSPPIDVMLIIVAVVAASATLHAAGGLTYMVQLAERLLRRHPRAIVILAPLCTYFLTMAVGTGHAVYMLQPIIADVAYKTGIRPERAMGVSSIASQMGITASPIAAAVTSFLAMALKAGHTVTLFNILSVTVPATFIGVVLAAIWSLNRGKDLDKDPEFQERMKDLAFRAQLEESVTLLNEGVSKKAKFSVLLFFAGVIAIVLIAALKLAPIVDGKPVSMTTVVQIVMLSAGALIMLYSRVKVAKIASSSVFTAGMVAVIAIMGIAWMSDTFIDAHKGELVETMKAMVTQYSWLFAVAMFCASAFVKSQAATLVIMVPVGFVLGIPINLLIGMIPASYAYFFFCFYPSDLSAINFDRTGTTRIGKYLLNHSFMIPGLIGVGTATVIGYVIGAFFLKI
ncbi:MAG TPA: anaerobic C4-dicarboxylate transporter [Dissulfurispiraceae bacterium]|nr:anaerobic C4-dicarboxylate transporter [Dissulfurispiraceae bacterium]